MHKSKNSMVNPSLGLDKPLGFAMVLYSNPDPPLHLMQIHAVPPAQGWALCAGFLEAFVVVSECPVNQVVAGNFATRHN